MAQRGGRRPGAGRKSNAEKLLEAGFVAGWFTQEFQEIKWKNLLESKDERVVCRALEYLTDRVFGRAQQAVDLNVSGNLDLAGRLAAARERAKKTEREQGVD